MPKFKCQCGNVIDLSKGVSSCEWTLIPEKTIDKIGYLLSEDRSFDEGGFYDAVLEYGITVYRCPQCDRLHLEEEKNSFVTYIKENSEIEV